ncbi:hypothetical protein [Aeromicrobium sp.]|uniref:hypothetical protein n=1 Tax=Aeromicrobium sp. TaxID=1871063 RepID=UPI0030C36CED
MALTVMALTAKDTDDQPIYFAGWRPIARALGLAGSHDSQRTTVSRVWRELRLAGCISPASDIASSRTTSTWHLLVEKWPHMNQLVLPVDNPSGGG